MKEANKLLQYEWIDLCQQVWFMYPADVKRNLSNPADPFPNKFARALHEDVIPFG